MVIEKKRVAGVPLKYLPGKLYGRNLKLFQNFLLFTTFSELIPYDVIKYIIMMILKVSIQFSIAFLHNIYIERDIYIVNSNRRASGLNTITTSTKTESCIILAQIKAN